MCFEQTSKVANILWAHDLCFGNRDTSLDRKKPETEMALGCCNETDETAEALDYGWSWEWKGADWDILGRETVIWKQSGYTCGGLGMVREPQQSIIRPSPPGLEPHSLSPQRSARKAQNRVLNGSYCHEWTHVYFLEDNNVKLHIPSPYWINAKC